MARRTANDETRSEDRDGRRRDGREAWRLLLVVHARMTAELERRAAAAGALPGAWFDLLVVLDSSPHRRARLGDLAEAVLLTRAGLSRLIDRVEAAGYLRREPCPDDGRGMFATLTEAGAAAVRASWPVHLRAADELVGEPLGEDAADVADCLRRVAAANDWLPELRPVTLTVPARRRLS